MVSLFEVAVLLLCIAFSGLLVLRPVLDYLHAISLRNPILSATAGAATLLALPMAYFAGIILVYLQIAPVPHVLVSPVALRLFATMACALLLLAIIMPLVLWL
ncbi:hypothetical protein BAE44_0010912 [Dichanthelium oligosanthes]|uniref:Uncharacterized protein n=1 Tax=Dichanthelium oligosanthes TaxID=888268 RepID=A0A1E5VSG0_9POAL|nr:hypothetical protein BAE44_0010912 [Dichanthelium oligosanthes]